MHTLVPTGATLPFAGKHVFSTVHDDQREICILIYSGNDSVASRNELLGQFDLSGLPASKARTLQIEVRLRQPRFHDLVSALVWVCAECALPWWQDCGTSAWHARLCAVSRAFGCAQRCECRAKRCARFVPAFAMLCYVLLLHLAGSLCALMSECPAAAGDVPCGREQAAQRHRARPEHRAPVPVAPERPHDGAPSLYVMLSGASCECFKA